MQPNQHPIVALATPAGIGAIGVIRISGDGALSLVDGIFKGKRLAEQAGHTAHFGTILDGDIAIDEVLATVFRSPRSYTGQDTVEISCHGSPYILQRVIELLVAHGAQPAKAGEFTLRAFLNGKLDLAQAEAVADLIAAENEAMRRVALQQMRHGFSEQLADLREQLLQFAALIELELDFSTEDVEFADRRQLQALVERLQAVLLPMIQSFRWGNVLKNGVATVIAGRPNAGKSTLLNVLLNDNRAIVSDIPGTTRDTIEEILYIDGIAFRLIDTAGIRQSTDAIERIGVARTLEKIAKATLLVYVFDVTQMSLSEVESDLGQWQRDGMTTIVVANKMDCLAINAYDHFSRHFPLSYLPISAQTRSGIAPLRQALLQAAGSNSIAPDSTLITNVRHYEALQKAHTALNQVLGGMQQGKSSELLAFDLRVALDYLGQITGKSIDSEEVLGAIFSRFCIGK
jgi:tRNA modification GTPase